MSKEIKNNIGEISDGIKKIIEDLIQKTTFEVQEISVSFYEEGNEFWGKIITNEPRFLIGRNGEHLNAFSHIIKKIIKKRFFSDNEFPINVTIDVNDYQKKRIDNLKNMAHMMAERAKFFKSNMDIDPMSSYDRRSVHEFLADIPNLKTESTGEGRYRHIVIKYISE